MSGSEQPKNHKGPQKRGREYWHGFVFEVHESPFFRHMSLQSYLSKPLENPLFLDSPRKIFCTLMEKLMGISFLSANVILHVLRSKDVSGLHQPLHTKHTNTTTLKLWVTKRQKDSTILYVERSFQSYQQPLWHPFQKRCSDITSRSKQFDRVEVINRFIKERF